MKEEEDPEIEEEEDPKMKEEEEEEMEIDDEMDDPEVINPYDIEEGELSPLPAESDTSFDIEPEVEVEVEDETEAATIGTITRAPYHVHMFLSNSYVGCGSSHQVRATGPIGKDVDTLLGLMLEDREEKEKLKKKLKVVQEEKEIMPPKAMSQAAIEGLITQKVNAALEMKRARQ
nr:hypothetical protein [Tanacetum cinerariifolium]